jgi:hypothetical protein
MRQPRSAVNLYVSNPHLQRHPATNRNYFEPSVPYPTENSYLSNLSMNSSVKILRPFRGVIKRSLLIRRRLRGFACAFLYRWARKLVPHSRQQMLSCRGLNSNLLSASFYHESIQEFKIFVIAFCKCSAVLNAQNANAQILK